MDSDTFARLFGYFSIGCWIVVFTPQIYENYKRKNTDGVSVSFLTFWIVGDILNLIGVILENLLFTMLLLAVYYLFADCALMGQVFYYRRKNPNPKHVEEVVVSYGTQNQQPQHRSRSSSTSSSSSSSSSSSDSSSHFSGLSHHNQCLQENSPLLSLTKTQSTIKSMNPDTKRVIRIFYLSSLMLWSALLLGSAYYFISRDADWSQLHPVSQLLGWGSAILYCVSRIPQIMQNFRNESCEGLSLVMFVFSVVGNITYCVSIMLESTDPTYLLINYPWLLGSGGTLFFDFTIFFQFYKYRQRTDIDLKHNNHN